VRDHDRPPVVERVLALAHAIVRELGWLAAGHAAAR
jgi:hypothetical protein